MRSSNGRQAVDADADAHAAEPRLGQRDGGVRGGDVPQRRGEAERMPRRRRASLERARARPGRRRREALERWLNSPMTRSLPMRSSRAASANTTPLVLRRDAVAAEARLEFEVHADRRDRRMPRPPPAAAGRSSRCPSSMPRATRPRRTTRPARAATPGSARDARRGAGRAPRRCRRRRGASRRLRARRRADAHGAVAVAVGLDDGDDLGRRSAGAGAARSRRSRRRRSSPRAAPRPAARLIAPSACRAGPARLRATTNAVGEPARRATSRGAVPVMPRSATTSAVDPVRVNHGRAGCLGGDLDLGPVHAVRAAERLDERLLRGVARGERARRSARSAAANSRSSRRGRALERALEPRDVDEVDADPDDHVSPPFGIRRGRGIRHLSRTPCARRDADAATRP